MIEKDIEKPAFAFWLEDGHVLIAGNNRPKSGLMLLRCASALLQTLAERAAQEVGKAGNVGVLVENFALRLIKLRARYKEGKSDRAPDAQVIVHRDYENVLLAKLLTSAEHTRLCAAAVSILEELRPAVFLDARECAEMLGRIATAAEPEGGPIEWCDPFGSEEKA